VGRENASHIFCWLCQRLRVQSKPLCRQMSRWTGDHVYTPSSWKTTNTRSKQFNGKHDPWL